ncbi:MAG: hypothetical protein HQM10_25380 [Candidatus Riflebacteria bacterium]|nr:hypothetical protein [Candidatus Riflebacteria bacterium]
MATIAETLIKQGEELGIKKGEELGIKATVKRMLDKGFNLEVIAQISGLPIDEIKKMSTQS